MASSYKIRRHTTRHVQGEKSEAEGKEEESFSNPSLPPHEPKAPVPNDVARGEAPRGGRERGVCSRPVEGPGRGVRRPGWYGHRQPIAPGADSVNVPTAFAEPSSS
ncbi:hypothetical protein BS78_10G017700 [Paspalum vaginatum]|nr:hypothetical protein BS78_10G017700 [Paspalum vaginatum]